ncbi:2'-5' RNA ligase family protein [Planococcus soli]|uniref:2'-5' RNA ligase family protein n=1 Tax=Planococcus soli TaxID=2666072 RepID=UPI00163D6719|nr:2'-5' RNA ligase family protein [Planococcus soli]
MQYFIGIVPPAEFKNKIIEFQQKYSSRKITAGVEPHLTLKAQGGLAEDKAWIDQVKMICASFSSFKLIISDPQLFGDDILYLSAHSPELFNLHNKIVQVISPTQETIKKYFEAEDFTPHITLGKTVYGTSQKELIDMKIQAEKELGPYPSFEVTFIRIYEESEFGNYTTYLDIELKH